MRPQPGSMPSFVCKNCRTPNAVRSRTKMLGNGLWRRKIDDDLVDPSAGGASCGTERSGEAIENSSEARPSLSQSSPTSARRRHVSPCLSNEMKTAWSSWRRPSASRPDDCRHRRVAANGKFHHDARERKPCLNRRSRKSTSS
jgi:hypothetical protein